MSLLLLCGPKHSGKTSAGLALRDLLGSDFVDVDALIEEQEGVSPRALYRQGDTFFKEAEARAITSIMETAEAGGTLVVAAGGGLIDNEAAMGAVDGRAVLVFLEVSAATAWNRIKAAARIGGGLPAFLDAEDPEASHAALHERRAAAYKKRAHITIDAGGKSPQQIALQIMRQIAEASHA
ncbi:MAG: shikimate kinase [Spirochaetaceae bacterium]|nr:shikimate kinase [Spirochaetaceae bacterium]